MLLLRGSMILDGLAWPGRGYGTLEPLPMTLGQRGSLCFLVQVSCARVYVRCGAVRGESSRVSVPWLLP